jgi:CheY-like chemotaxis protein
MNHAPLLLIVEDTPALARALARRATSVGWKSLHASSLAEARDLVQRISFDAWIIDRDLAGEEGMKLVRDHEAAAGTGTRRRRPRTALWTTAPHAPPVDIADYGVAVFGKLDVEGMLAWLTQEDAPPPRRRATG